MTATVLITRPEAQAHSFASKLKDRFGDAVRCVISPVVSIEPVDAIVDLSGAQGVVFTSANAVNCATFVGSVDGVRAWCVGARTAAIARKKGFDAWSADGSADELTALILSQNVQGQLIHVRGAETRGNVAEYLSDHGVQCDDIVVYEQEPKRLGREGLALLMGQDTVLVPVFSPKSAESLVKQGPFLAPVDAVAMSEAVANVVRAGTDWRVSTAQRPTVEEMIAGLARHLGGN